MSNMWHRSVLRVITNHPHVCIPLLDIVLERHY
jgi:hypothetical protein